MRTEAVRLIRETYEKTSQGQRDAGRRLGERLTDVTFWRNELNTELEALVAEAAQLTDVKRNVQKAIQDLEAPLHITQECEFSVRLKSQPRHSVRAPPMHSNALWCANFFE